MIRLGDRKLWGNEAADDEDPKVLSTYFLRHPIFEDFFDEENPLSIARARKGMGKSALLNEFANEYLQREKSIVVNIKGSELYSIADLKASTLDQQVFIWQQKICACINREIGSKIGVALNDDEILLVEHSELAGYKRKNFLGSLVDRIQTKSARIEKLKANNESKLLDRICRDNDWNVIFVIDDIDATFLNSEEEIYRLSTFFTACRELIRNQFGLKIRASIRSDVWASIRKKDEALDKVEQYIFDIYWSNKDLGRLLANRIDSYIERFDRPDIDSPRQELIKKGIITPRQGDSRTDGSRLHNPSWKNTLSMVFERQYPMGRRTVDNFRVIHTYAGGRPRWALQLCKMAGKEANKVHDSLIKFGHIKQILKEYGNFRLDDISREHIHQCPNVNLIVNSFSHQQKTYTTDQLFTFVKSKILASIDVVIDGVVVDEPKDLCRFLFQIGLIIGRETLANGVFEYYNFEKKPDLFKNFSNIDDGLAWVIHFSFQATLSVKD